MADVCSRWLGWFCALVIMLVASVAQAAERSLLKPDAADAFVLAATQAGNGTLEHIDVAGQPFHRAIRLVTQQKPEVEWGLQALLVTDVDIHRGDVLLARFWVRCEQSMTGGGFVSFLFEQNQQPYDKAAQLRLAAPGQWTQLFVPFRADQDYPAGKAHLIFRGGFDRETIDVGGIELIDYGPDANIDALPRTHITYAGHEPDAAWRKAANERIEEIRKAPLTLTVVDAAGHPVAGATVHATLTRHAFGFGSCVTADEITGTSADDARCREIIERYFSRVVFENDMKWPAVWDGVPRKVDAAVDWLRARHIEIRGHNLVWPSWQWLPPQLKAFQFNPDEVGRRVDRHIDDTVTHFKGKVIDWDVVNEPFTNTDLFKLLGGRDVMDEWFRRAKAIDPSCRMFLNDFGLFEGGPDSAHRQSTFDTIKRLKDRGVPIDGIGLQSHFAAELPPPEQLLKVLDQFGSLGLPMESTEISIIVDDRQVQADYLRDYMTALFSHPQVDGILLWGFWEGRHWRPTAALWATDWKKRPIADAWIDLVTKQWSTDVTLTTDAHGVASVRGFLGDYAIDALAGDRQGRAVWRLDKSGANATIRIGSTPTTLPAPAATTP